MPIATQCTAPGCETLTMGPFCVEHGEPVRRSFVRGRPWAPETSAHMAATSSYATLSPVVLSSRKAWARREAARALR